VRWEWIVVVYTAYFAIVAWTRGYSAAVKYGSVAALISAFALVILPAPIKSWQIAVHDWLPLVVLLAGYRLSGLFFVAPMRSLEERMLAFDRRVFDAVGLAPSHWMHAPALRAALELAYVLVYAMVPLGVVALHLSGASDQLPRYWAVVLAACFTSYAMLPWLQTRPPRVLEALLAPDARNPPADRAPFRRLNLAILRRTSNQVNTLPSGHVAAALAVALMVLASAPAAGLAFLALTVAIAIATVIGRYHYIVDTVTGLSVALASWWWLG
jgi:membrane-associated phospholipid phosphatase